MNRKKWGKTMVGAGKFPDEAALPGAAEQQPASGHAFSALICVPLRFQAWFKFKSN
jgi:hypothetical protein